MSGKCKEKSQKGGKYLQVTYLDKGLGGKMHFKNSQNSAIRKQVSLTMGQLLRQTVWQEGPQLPTAYGQVPHITRHGGNAHRATAGSHGTRPGRLSESKPTPGTDRHRRGQGAERSPFRGLWSCGTAPHLGTAWQFPRRQNMFLYDPANQLLSVHLGDTKMHVLAESCT